LPISIVAVRRRSVVFTNNALIFEAIRKLIHIPLFSRPQPLERSWDVISWWETRRLIYNALVGTAGVTSGIIILTTGYITEHMTGEATGIPDPPFFAIIAVIVYGVMANICFTGGWILELLSRQMWGVRAEAFGEIAFAWGILGSVLLTLSPAAIIVLYAVISVISHGWKQ
jgi:hypothetical protein